MYTIQMLVKTCRINILTSTLSIMTFKRTYERWGLKDGEVKLRIETSEWRRIAQEAKAHVGL